MSKLTDEERHQEEEFRHYQDEEFRHYQDVRLAHQALEHAAAFFGTIELLHRLANILARPLPTPGEEPF
jgi:hypothetical protein